MRRIQVIIYCFFLILLSTSATFSQTHEEHNNNHKHDHSNYLEKEVDRWIWQQPEKVLDSIGIKSGMVVADVGAGYGYFTLRIAQRVGKEGIVYANEIDESFLSIIQKRCQSLKINNVKTILGEFDDPNLPDSIIDVVLLVNVIHYVENKNLFLENIKKSINPDGILAIVQWEEKKLAADAPEGSEPDLDEFNEENLLKTIKSSGYNIEKIYTFLPLQNIYMCKPTVEVQ